MPVTIAIDLDEVLGLFVEPLCAFHNETYGTKLQLSDFTSYRFCEVWGGDDEEATKKIHEFFESPYFEDIPLVPGSLEAVKTLSRKGYDLVVVTSRQFVIEEQTRQWINNHFPGIFREIAFGNHWGKEGKKLQKKDMCKALGASVLIDDNLLYANEVTTEDVLAILFDLNGTYPWNKPSDVNSQHSDVLRATTWEEVLHIVEQRGGSDLATPSKLWI